MQPNQGVGRYYSQFVDIELDFQCDTRQTLESDLDIDLDLDLDIDIDIDLDLDLDLDLEPHPPSETHVCTQKPHTSQ